MRIEDRIVFSSSSFHIGKFRCPPFGKIWCEENQNGNSSLFVFPRVPVTIHQAGRASVVATPNEVMLYNPLQSYRRRAIDPRGDQCEYIGVESRLLSEVIRSVGIEARSSNSDSSSDFAPFEISHTTCNSNIYLAQRLLFTNVHEAQQKNEMELEETFLSLLPKLVQCSFRQKRCQNPPESKSKLAKHRDLVAATQEIIARKFRSSITLNSIAEDLDCSTFHLCRVFKEATSTSIYSSIRRMRLLSSLEQVLESDLPMTRIALEHQFSSHSHFTSSFRKLFGVAPGMLRIRNSDRADRLLREIRDNWALA